MTKTDIADLLDRAASLLGLEEVMYSLGLDHDHDQTVEHVESFDAAGRPLGIVEVPIPEDEAEARMEREIEQHGDFVQRLADAAASLREEVK